MYLSQSDQNSHLSNCTNVEICILIRLTNIYIYMYMYIHNILFIFADLVMKCVGTTRQDRFSTVSSLQNSILTKRKRILGSRALVSLASNQLINHNLHDVGINGNRD